MKRRKPNKPDVTPLHVQLPADVRKAIVDQAKSGNRTIRGELIETLTRAYGLQPPPPVPLEATRR